MGIWILILGLKGLKERTEEQQGLTLIVHFIELSIKKRVDWIYTDNSSCAFGRISVQVCLSFCPVQESISTCRFAQRVAMIKNDVLLNEEIDPKLVSFWSYGLFINTKNFNSGNLEHVIYFRNVDGAATNHKKVLDKQANLKPTN